MRVGKPVLILEPEVDLEAVRDVEELKLEFPEAAGVLRSSTQLEERLARGALNLATWAEEGLLGEG